MRNELPERLRNMPVTQEPELAVQTYVARAMLDGVTGDDLTAVAQ